MRWLIPLLLLWSVPATAHPQHRTTAQVEVDRNRGKIEVGLRVLPHQLEKALQHARTHQDDAPLSRDQQIVNYLQQRFRVGPPAKTGKVHWIGSERDGADLWLYFEFDLPKREFQLSNRVFFELHAHQINVVRLRNGTKKRTVSQTLETEPLQIHP